MIYFISFTYQNKPFTTYRVLTSEDKSFESTHPLTNSVITIIPVSWCEIQLFGLFLIINFFGLRVNCYKNFPSISTTILKRSKFRAALIPPEAQSEVDSLKYFN